MQLPRRRPRQEALSLRRISRWGDGCMPRCCNGLSLATCGSVGAELGPQASFTRSQTCLLQ